LYGLDHNKKRCFKTIRHSSLTKCAYRRRSKSGGNDGNSPTSLRRFLPLPVRQTGLQFADSVYKFYP